MRRMVFSSVRGAGCVLVLYTSVFCFSQQITLLERKENNSVEYCKVIVNDHVLFTNKTGELTLTGLNDKARVMIDDFRYKKQIFIKPEKDTIIYLESNPTLLEDVTVISKNIFKSKKDKKSGYSHSFIQGIEYGFLIENKIKKPGNLIGLEFYVNNVFKDCMLNLSFYNTVTESSEESQRIGFINILLSKNKTQDDLEIDLSSSEILINDDSFFLVMRIYNTSGDYLESVSDDKYMSLKRSKRNTKSYLYRKDNNFKWADTYDTGIGISYIISY